MNMSICKFVGPTAWVTGSCNCCSGIAMIAAIEREDLMSMGMKSDHANGIFYSIRASVGKEDFIVMGSGASSDSLRCLPTRFICMLRSNCSDESCLILNCFDNLRMLKSNIGEDQLTGEIEIFFSVKIPEVTSFSPSYWKWRNL